MTMIERATFQLDDPDRATWDISYGPKLPLRPFLRDVSVPAVATGGQTVNVSGVSKTFGERELLRDLDLSVPAGEFLAVIGRSGCGKTTLLRLIAGLDRANNGTITVDG